MTDEYPSYLDDMEVGDERTIRARIDALTGEIAALRRTLDDARRAKKILLVEGDELADETVRFLHEDLGLDVTRMGRGPEGSEIWMPDDEGRPWALVLVMASDDGNVTKHDVAQAMLKRDRAGRDEQTPLLLVANTYRMGKVLAERDTPIAADVVRRCAEDRILVTRTLDLVRLGQRGMNGFPAAQQLRDSLEAGGGWFEVDPSLTATARAA